MKPSYVLLFVSLAMTGAAGLYQTEPPAEKVYKNIKTLVGSPASEVIPSMKFMSASLKVDCDFCHKQNDFASDEKREKSITRHMIEMQRDINTKNFNGRLQVTCNTCHNGSPSPNRTPSLPGISRRTIKRDASAVNVSDVLKKFANASGDELKSVTFEGTISGMGPGKIPAKVAQGAPNKFKMQLGDRTLGFDGTKAWYSQAGQTTVMPGSQGEELQNYGRFYRGAHAFDGMGELRFAGRDKVNGADVVVLRAGAPNAKVSTDLYFDAKSGLLMRVATYTATVLGSMPDAVEYSDHRKVGNAMVPFRISRMESKEPAVTQFIKATANPSLSEGFFAPPSDK